MTSCLCYFPILYVRSPAAFLLARSAFGFTAAFLARPAFFAGLAFLPALRVPLGFAASGGG